MFYSFCSFMLRSLQALCYLARALGRARPPPLRERVFAHSLQLPTPRQAAGASRLFQSSRSWLSPLTHTERASALARGPRAARSRTGGDVVDDMSRKSQHMSTSIKRASSSRTTSTSFSRLQRTLKSGSKRHRFIQQKLRTTEQKKERSKQGILGAAAPSPLPATQTLCAEPDGNRPSVRSPRGAGPECSKIFCLEMFSYPFFPAFCRLCPRRLLLWETRCLKGVHREPDRGGLAWVRGETGFFIPTKFVSLQKVVKNIREECSTLRV